MISKIQHGELDTTSIATESAIFAHVIIELKHTNAFLNTT